MLRSLIRYTVLVLILGVLATASGTSVVARVAPAAAPAQAAPATPVPLAWGSNEFGQLGDGNPSTSPVTLPVPVDTTGQLSGKTVTALAAGGVHSLALDSTGTVYAWGTNDSGELGNGDIRGTPSYVPVPVDTTGQLSGKTIVAIAAGGYHSLALDSTGQVYGWGANNDGQIGNDSVAKSFVPVAVYSGGVLAGKKIVAISGGYQHSLALDSTGAVYAWGDNTNGELGNNTQTSGGHAVAVDTSGVLAGKKIIAIAAGGYHSLALDSTGLVYAWGDNTDGQLGSGRGISYSLVPVAVSTGLDLAGKTITAIAAGSVHSLALDSTGLVYAWGNNFYGQLGDGNNYTLGGPNLVDTAGVLNGKTITAIAGGYYHSLALDNTGQVYAWGANDSGELGNGDGGSGKSSNVPVATSLPITQHVSALGAGSQSIASLALAHTGGPTLDDDVSLQYSSGTSTSALIAEGWLHIVPDPKNPANSVGTFTDTMAGGKTYPVTYNGATLQFTLNTIYGKFVLNYNYIAVSYPTRFGAGAAFYFATARPHHYTTATYKDFEAYANEGYGQKMVGQLILTFDNLNYIVPDNLKAGHPSRLVGTIGNKAFVAPITQSAVYEPTFGSAGDDTLIFSAKIAGQLYHFQSYDRILLGDWGTYNGLAYTDGATKHGVVYHWHIQ